MRKSEPAPQDSGERMKAASTQSVGVTLNAISRAGAVDPADDLLLHAEHSEGSNIPVPSTDFSLVLGGPLFQLCRRAHLSGDALELLHRQALVIALLAWLPLVLLSLIEGRAIGGVIRIPFLHDIEANLRFLVALPVLIFAEFVVHQRVSP